MRSDRDALVAFVKAHHPDLGGDHETFVTGFGRWDETAPVRGRAPANVEFRRRRRGFDLLPWRQRRPVRRQPVR